MLEPRRGQPRLMSGKVVAITGGARGIGHATGQALAHLTKADDILSHIDPEERAAYVERVKASA